MPADAASTIVSTKGQVILPKQIRDRRRWSPGTRLLVEETADGVLLRSAPDFQPALPNEIYGSLRIAGKPKSVEEMDEGILQEARRRAGD